MKSEQAIISVCIPAYNEEKYIIRCLDSIRSQRDVTIGEILVGINSSTDQTKELVENYSLTDPRVRVVDSPKGKANAWNALNRAASYNIRVFQDGDTTVPFSAYHGLLSEIGDNDIVGASVQRNSKGKGLIIRSVYFPSKYVYPYTVLNGNLYMINYNGLVTSMINNIGVCDMPADTINDDEFLQVVTIKIKVCNNVFVCLDATNNVKDEIVRFKRMKLGNLQLRNQYPKFYQNNVEGQINRYGKLSCLFTLYNASTRYEKLCFPIMMFFKFIAFKYIHSMTNVTDINTHLVWK